MGNSIAIIILSLTIILLGTFTIQGVKQAQYMGIKNAKFILQNTKQITSILENQKFILEKCNEN